ncbi:hypothetical protein ACQ4PT_063799 [Festuca glaucescens]
MQPWESSSRARSWAKRVSVPESLWMFLYETSSARKPDNIVTFPSDCQPCEICDQKLSVVASVEDNLRAVKLKQRQRHEKLISGKGLALHPGKNIIWFLPHGCRNGDLTLQRLEKMFRHYPSLKVLKLL